MGIRWYESSIGGSLFRKLTLMISVPLLAIFLTLGWVTHHFLYNLLESREQELLAIRTERFQEQLLQIIGQFKKESISFYSETITVGNRLTAQSDYLDTIPPADDSVAALFQKNFFRNLLTIKSGNIPAARILLIYRSADGMIFDLARDQQKPKLQPFDRMPAEPFFEAFPKEFHTPYIGRIDQETAQAGSPVLYMTNPIYQYNSFDRIIGYFMIMLDPQELTELYSPSMQKGGRLVIRIDGQTWFDSQPETPVPPPDDTSYLRKSYSLKRYGLDITAMQSKNAIEAKLRPIQWLTFATLAFALLVCIAIISNIQKRVVRRLQVMIRYFAKVRDDPFVPSMNIIGHDEISHLGEQFNDMLLRLQEHIRRMYIVEIQKRNAQFSALKMQINPHFLYNTLESLRMQSVVSGQPVIGEKLYRLGKLFKWILKAGDDTVPILEELNYSQSYLDLLMMGKSNRIEVKVETELDLSAYRLLKFTLQPIFENAVFHGKLEETEGAFILLCIRENDEALAIEITNNGRGLQTEERLRLQQQLEQQIDLHDERIGLKNVHDRIVSYYGKPYGLSVLSLEPVEGFGVTIYIPNTKEGS